MQKSNESFTIILPLPSGLLSPNCVVGSIGGRFAKAGAAKKQRRLSREAVQASGVETLPWRMASVSSYFFCRTRRRRDTDNAQSSLKSAYDGLVDAGLVHDDTPEYMKRGEPVFAVDKENPRLEMVLERLE